MQVDVDNVLKVWGDPSSDEAVVALEAITHRFAPARFSCLLGPSGCGKSTLLQIIGGMVQPTAGEVRIGRDGHSVPVGSHSVMVWQSINLFPWRTVIDNVAFGLEVEGVDKATRYARAREYLQRVGLRGFETKYPHQLSGGMRQRVGIARALIKDPDILLMDEPFGALDAQSRAVLQEEVAKIFEQTQKTIIFVTHSIDEAILLGDEVVVMTARPGRVKEVIPIDLPRPRQFEMTHTREFDELFQRIYDLIREEVRLAMQQETAANV